MTKYLLIALALVAALAGAYGAFEHQRAEVHKARAARSEAALAAANAAVETLTAQAKLQREVSLARQREINRLRQLAEATQKALNEAIKDNPDWAREPLPDSVLRALIGAGDPEPARPSVDRAGPEAEAAGP